MLDTIYFEQCIHTFYFVINTVIDLFVAKKFVSCNANSPPWFNSATKQLVIQKKIAYKKY